MEPNTGYYATVVEDSINPSGIRLTTLEICFPRFILAEFNTHRVLSRNSASSRAIPVAKQLERINKYPFVPEAFPLNKPGMSATEYVRPGCIEYMKARDAWLFGRDKAVQAVEALLELNVHKQTANRLLEPYMYHTVVVTATDWDNFYNLRISPHAQPEINKIATMMQDAMSASTPRELQWKEMHLPYVDDSELEDLGYMEPFKVSAGRCAAVTLLNHQKKEAGRDVARTDGLIANGHMSPLEHPAVAVWNSDSKSNFHSTWKQFRKFIPGEEIYTKEDE